MGKFGSLERECQAQRIDKLVDVGQPVVFVQSALEPVTKKRPQALTVADALEDRERKPHAVGG